MKKNIIGYVAVLSVCFLIGCKAQKDIGQAGNIVLPDTMTSAPAPAISLTPTPTVATKTEPTTTETPTPYVSQAPSAAPEPAATSVQTVAPKSGASGLHPIVASYGNFLLGGSDGKKWFKPNGLINSGDRIEPSEIAKSINGGERYKLYSLDRYLGDGIGGKVLPHDEDWGGLYTEYVEIEHSIENEDFIAVSCDWDCMPRKPVVLSNESQIYIDIVKDVLAENGLENATAKIVQNYSIDLDGDGMDEVVTCAEYNDSDWRFGNSKGAYSLLLLRKVVDGNVKNIILHIDIDSGELIDGMYYKYRYVFGICGFLDLNGDGKLELITSGQGYEDMWYDVYEITRDNAVHIMNNGWGA